MSRSSAARQMTAMSFLPGRSDGGVALSERLWRTRFAADLLRLVLGGGLKLTAIGVAIGVAASAALVRSLATLLFGVPPLDPMTFVVAPLSLTVVALLACLAPAIHALRADPVAALRAE